MATPWRLSSSSDPAALAVVDGLGVFAEHGPHYSRRTPGSKTFTGCGQEVVLLTTCGRAVWAVVRQKTPHAKGSAGNGHQRSQWVWRNMLFRNLGAGLSSELIQSATVETYQQWERRYGELPPERLRTEIRPKAVRSINPGACYQIAGWERGRLRRGILFFYAPLGATE